MSMFTAGIRLALTLLSALGLGAPASTPPTGTPATGPGPTSTQKQVGVRQAEKPAGARKWALVIGVGRYNDPDIPEIAFCNKDAIDLAGALRASGYEVVCLTDQGMKGGDLPAATPGTPTEGETQAAIAPLAPDAPPTRENILQRVQSFLADERIGEKDLALVYFSGHGFATEDAAYLATRDADLERLDETRIDVERLETTCISVKWLRQQLESCRARQKVLLLDSCHSGTPPKEAKGTKLAPSKPKLPAQDAGRIFAAASAESGMVTLASCRGSESSWQKGENSAFTFYLLEGLAQAADGNRDGHVDITELNKYVHRQVVAYAKDLQVEQTPVFHSVGLEGDITLAPCAIRKEKSNTLLYIGGAGALGAIAAVAGGGGGGGSGQQPTTGTVSGYVYRTTGRSWERLEPVALASRQGGGRLCITPQAISLPEWTPAVGAVVSVDDGLATATAGDNGFFSVTVPQGNHTMAASLDGYASVSAPVTVMVGATITVTAGYTDATAPRLSSAVVVDSTHIDLAFDETLQGASVNLLTNYTFEPSLAVSGAEMRADGKTIRLTASEQTDGQDYTVTVSNVTDTAGNVVDPASNKKVFKGKGTPPQVESQARPRDQTHVDVVFSEAVDAATANTVGNYSFSPALTVTAAELQADGKTVKITTAEQAQGVTYVVTVTGVRDTAMNVTGSSGNTATFPGVGEPPKVESATPYDATHVDVVFSEPVQQIAASTRYNYVIVPELAVSAAVVQVDGKSVRLTTAAQTAGVSYSLVVNGVRDLAGNQIAGGNNMALFTGIAATLQVVSATPIDSTHVDIRFDRDVDAASSGTAGNFGITPTVLVSEAALLADGRTIRLTTGEQAGGVTYTMTVAGVRDKAGSTVSSSDNTAKFQGIGVPPRISAATAKDSSHVDVVFDEALDPSTAAVAGNYSVAPSLVLAAAVLQADGKTVRLTTAEQMDGATYTVTAASVRDAAGNLIGSTGNSAAFAGIGVPPRVVSAVASDATHVDVRFSETVDANTATAVANYAVAPALQISEASLLPDGKTVRLTTADQALGTSYTVTVKGVKDAASNEVGSTGNSAIFSGGGIAPQLTSVSSVDSNLVDLVFSKPMDGATANIASNYVISPALVVHAAALQEDGKTVRLVTDEQANAITYTVTVTGAKDTTGNAIDPSNSSMVFVGIGPAPRVLSAAVVDSTHVDIVFSRDLDAATAGATTNYAISPLLAVSVATQVDARTVRLTTDEQVSGVTYTAMVSSVKDTAGTPVGSTENSASFAGMGVSPQVVAVVAVDPTHVDLAFSEMVDAVSANTGSNYSISPQLAVSAAAIQADGKSVRITTAEQVGGTQYTIAVSGVKDVAGNAVATSGNAAAFTGIAPALRVVSAVAVDSVTVDIVFNKPVDAATGAVTANYPLTPMLPATSATVQADGKTVRLATAEQTEGVTYTVAVTGVADAGGTAIAAPDNSATFAGIGVAPQLISAVAIDGTHVDVTFSETVDATLANAAGNYSIVPALSVTAASRQADGKTVRLTTASQAADTDYTLTVNNVRDLAGNAITSAGSTTTFAGFGAELRVVSASPVGSTQIDVVFSAALDTTTANTASNYVLNPALQATPALQPDGRTVRLTTGEQTGGASYTLTVTGVRGADGKTIADGKNAATFIGVGTPPQVASAASINSTTVEITFSEPLDPASINTITNYVITAGDGAVAVTATGAVLQSDTKVRLTTGEHTNGKDYTVVVSGVTDAAGNAIGTIGNTAGYTGIGVAAQVESAAAVDSSTIEVTFSEALDVNSANAGTYTLSPRAGGVAVDVSAAVAQSDPKKVRLTTAEHTNGIQYTVTVGGVKDLAGNPMAATSNSAAYIAIGTPPRVASALAVDSTTVDITFSEALGSTPGKYTLTAATDGITVTVVTATVTEAAKVRLTTTEHTNGIGYTVSVADVKDLAGNAIGTSDNSAAYAGIGVAPEVTSASALGSTTVEVVFNEALNRAAAEDTLGYSISPELSVVAAALQPDSRAVRLTTAVQARGTDYTVTVSGAKDAALNAVGTTKNTGTFTGVDTTPPQVVSAEAVDSTTVEVTFGEPVDATANTASSYALAAASGGSAVSVTAAQIQSDTSKVRLTTTEHTNGISYSVTVRDVKDLAGNTIGTTGNSASYTGKGVAPTIASATATSSTQVTVVFSEDVTGITSGTYTIKDAGGNTLNVSGRAQGSDSRTAILTTDLQTNGATYTLTVTGIADLANNPVATDASATFSEAIPPQLAPDGVQATSATTVDVTFSEPIQAPAPTSFVVTYGTGSALAITGVTLDADKAVAHLTTDPHTNGTTYSMKVTGVRDLAGNTISDATVGFNEVMPPQVVSVASASATTVNVVFNEPLEQASAQTAANYTISPYLQVKSSPAPALQADGKTVVLTTAQQMTYSYTLTATGVKDSLGNAIPSDSATANTGTFAGYAGSAGGMMFASYRVGNGLTHPISVKAQANSPWDFLAEDANGIYTFRHISPSPDGTRYVYTWSDHRAYAWRLGIRTMTHNKYNMSPDKDLGASRWCASWSPRGDAIAYRESGKSRIQLMNPEGTFLGEIPNTDGAETPKWTACGRIAYAAGGEIYTIQQDGSGQQRITNDSYTDSSPDISPDGAWIAYVSYRNGAYGLYKMQLNPATGASVGVSRCLLASGVSTELPPFGPAANPPAGSRVAWSPDGKWIGFTRERPSDTAYRDLYKIDPNADTDPSKQPVMVWDKGNGPYAVGVGDMSWGPEPQSPTPYSAMLTTDRTIIPADGNTNATLTIRVRDGSYQSLTSPVSVSFTTTAGTLSSATATTDGSGQATVTIKGATPGTATVTATVAGGKNPVATATVKLIGQGQLAFGLGVGADIAVWVLNPDGTGLARVTHNSGTDWHPAWSRDASRVAFSSNRDGNYEIYVMNADGTGQTRLTNDPANDSMPAWSPDGTQIAFTSNRGGTNQIYLMRADGTDVSVLTNLQGERPAWSPSGSRIAYQSTRDGNYEIYVMNADGTGQTRLTNNSSWDSDPVWSPDESLIAYTVFPNGGNRDVYVMNADGTGQTRLTTEPNEDKFPAWSPDGARIAFISNRDGSYKAYTMGTDGTGQTAIATLGGTPYNLVWSAGLSASGRAIGGQVGRRTPQVRLRAACRGQEAELELTLMTEAAGTKPIAPGATPGMPAGAGRTAAGLASERGASVPEPALRFEPIPGGSGLRSPGSGRAWEFLLHSLPDQETVLNWPDLSGLGSRDRVTLEDLDANVRRSMRTTASYTFRGESRRFRVTAAPRAGAAALITGLEMAPTRGGTRVVRFNLSTDATVDVELLSPTGPVVAAVARQRAAVAGVNQVSWRGEVSAGIYLLRATATTEDGTRVQAVRPVVVTR